MSIGGAPDQGGQLYSIERAQHESRYIYAVVMAELAIHEAIQDCSDTHEQVSDRFKAIMGDNTFGKDAVSESLHHLALTELNATSENQMVEIDKYQRQLQILGKLARQREDQAASDWRLGEDHGIDVLFGDAASLLPIPGTTALERFGINQLGEPLSQIRQEMAPPLLLEYQATDAA